MAAPVTIDIHIDRLRLAGYSRSERDRLLAAMRRELARLAADGEDGARGPGTREIKIADRSVPLDPGLRAETVGVRLAREIWTACLARTGADTGVTATHDVQ